MTQYTQDVWNTDAGLPSNSITGIVRLPDGYLWIGTEEGLVRFDGVHFTVLDRKNTPALGSNHISALVSGSHGSLWIGTQGGGLTEFQDGRFITYTSRNGLANDTVLSLYEDEKGVLWIGTNGGGLQRFQNGKFTTYSSRNGLPNDAILCLTGSKDGSLWIGTHTGLARLQHNQFSTYTTKQGLGDNYIKCLHAGPSGHLWIGTNQGGISEFVNGTFLSYTKRDGLSDDTIWSIYEDQAGTVWIGTNEAGLNRFRNGRFTSYSVKDGFPAPTILSFLEDREGNFWVGTLGGGLVRLKDGPFTVFTTRQGLTNDVVLPVFEDHEGTVWIGTNGGGINRLKDGKITSYTTKNGLSDNVVLSIGEDRERSLWIATRKRLDRLKNGKITHFTTGSGLPDSIIVSLYTDRQGTLWAGSRAGLCRFDGHRFTVYTTKDGLSNNYVVSIYEDQRNTLWIGTSGGGLNRLENGHFSSLTTRNGLSSNTIWSITGDPDGTLWIGTGGGGLNRLKNGSFTVYSVRNGLFDDEVFQILSDRHGYLWMTSNKGIFRVPKWQLNAYAEGHAASITSIAYDSSAGLKNKECNGGIQPAGWQTKDGRLLFPTMKGLAIVDPARLGKNTMPPPVAIEQVTIDGSKFDPTGPIQAKPGRGQLQFDFTALSLVAPDKAQFKYKLAGFDKDWTDAGTRRTAYYTNIRPGEYQFTVIACNNDGIWNSTGASVSLALLPHFYQTQSFVALCSALLMGLCFGGYRLRISHLKANEKKLALIVEQRTQELQEEVHAKERARAELAEAQQHLMDLSRLSGMAEVASGVLHNVGNVLNSVNVGASVIGSKLREFRLENLTAAVNMLQEHAGDLSGFLVTDVKGQRILPYLAKLSAHLSGERQQLVSEVDALTGHIDHIKQIVATQQDYARASSLAETISPSLLLDDALRIVASSLGRHNVEVIRELDEVHDISAPKHKVMEILVNLIRNAKESVIEHNGSLRQVRICIRQHASDRVRLEVHDTGVGIPPENLTRIFAYGFTTKPKGHGFGLHSGALAARQMQGSLWAESKGLGHGASLILELPVALESASA